MKSQWTIGKKLIVGFMSVAAITLLLGVVGYYGMTSMEGSINEIGHVRLPSVDSTLAIEKEAENIAGAMRTLAVPGLSDEIRKRQYDALTAARERYEKAWDVYEPLPQTEEEAHLWEDFVPAWNAWRTENNRAMELSQEYDQLGISDPYALLSSLEKFRGDHYQLELRVQTMLEDGTVFDGGDDHTACNYGQWVTSFETDNSELRQVIHETKEDHKRFHHAVASIKGLVEAGKLDEARAVYHKELEPAANATFAAYNEMRDLANQAADTMDKLQKRLLGPVTERQREAIALLDEIVEINRSVAEHEVDAAHNQAAFLETFGLVAAVLGVATAVGCGVLISRGVNKALRRIADALSAGAEQTASAAGQVSSSSQSLAEGASEQAASIEETTSSVEEMASMTKQNASNAEEANNLASAVRSDADGGIQAMERMSKAIDDIKAGSDETAKIIKTIDEIAFQTNLLALNAAVEAARAGEAGKGFAVVAEEVRNLAQRSAEAAKNTAEMIQSSVKNADNGVSISKEVGEMLTKIAEGNRKANDLVSEITAASKEQSQGIEQINTAVGQMDQVTQSSAANAEESASAAEELSSQAEELNNMVAELRQMVGGSGQDVGSTGKAAKSKKHDLHFAHDKGKSGASGSKRPRSKDKAAAKSSAGSAPAEPRGGQDDDTKAAEEAIPMGDDDELASF